MHIKKLELKNFQVIEDFNFEFDGGIYFITGDNEQGKSTLLKSIGILLDGNRDEVLKKGAEKGFAKAVIGDDNKEYKIELKFTEANPRGTLKITTADGMESSQVSMLQKIFGYTDFDAVEFSRWSETAEGRRKQINVVKSLLPKEVQTRIEEIDSELKSTKETRKEANSSLKTYKTIVENASKGLEDGDSKKYAKKIDIEDLMKQQSENAQLIEKAKTVRQALEQRTQQLAAIPERLQNLNSTFETYEADLLDKIRLASEKLQLDIQAIKDEQTEYETKKQNAEKWLSDYEANNPEKTDTAEKLKEAQEHNEKHQKVVELQTKQKDLQKAENDVKKLETKVSSLLEERENLISTSSLPIDGLTFTEDGLELNGVPFVAGHVSDSQIMEIAMKLTVAVNPNVKVVRIARGESLGENRLKQIIEHAKENGFQGFIENVVRGQQDLRVEEYTEI